jgi:hypothetical protein
VALIDHKHYLVLDFTEFMIEFRAAYLLKDWEETIHIELLGMNQRTNQFWDFTVVVQSKNTFFCDTGSHLNKKKLCHRIESGMTAKLANRCRLDKVRKIKKFIDWLTEVKRIDNLLCAECLEWEAMHKTVYTDYHCNNTLAKPSCHANTIIGPSSNSECVNLLKLLDSERKLLNNEGCLKCQCFFVNHHSKDCPNDFSPGMNYIILTQAWVDTLKSCIKHTTAIAAIVHVKMDSPTCCYSDGNLFHAGHIYAPEPIERNQRVLLF